MYIDVKEYPSAFDMKFITTTIKSTTKQPEAANWSVQMTLLLFCFMFTFFCISCSVTVVVICWCKMRTRVLILPGRDNPEQPDDHLTDDEESSSSSIDEVKTPTHVAKTSTNVVKKNSIFFKIKNLFN